MLNINTLEMKKIKTKEQYESTLERFESIFQAKDGTPESDEAYELSMLITDYENEHFVIEAPADCCNKITDGRTTISQ